MTGPEIPIDFPKKYTRNLQRVVLFNASMAWEIQELLGWQKRHGIEMEKEAVSVFEDYLKGNHAIRMTLVEHPKVTDPAATKPRASCCNEA